MTEILKENDTLRYMINPEGKITSINDTISKYGYNPKELIGTNLIDIINPADRKKAKYRIDERRTGDRKTKSFLFRIIPKNREREIDQSLCQNRMYYLDLESEGVYSSEDSKNEFLGTSGVAKILEDGRCLAPSLMSISKVLEKRVEERTSELSDYSKELEREIENRKEIELDNKVLVEKLNNKVREVGFLYDLSKILENKDYSIEEIFRYTLELLTNLYDQTKISGIRIKYGRKEFRTEKFEPEKRTYSSSGKSNSGLVLRIDVCLPGDKECREKSRFETSDKELIDEIVERIVMKIHRLNAEEALADSEAKWRELLESLPNFVLELDLEGKVKNCNKHYPGFNIADFIGKSIFEISPAQGRKKLKALFPKVIRDKTSIEFETQPYEPDISKRWYLHQLAPVKDKNEIKSIILIISDITDRKRAEEVLRENENKISAIVNNVIDGIITVDEEGVIVSVNNATCDIFGYLESELVGNNIKFLMLESVAEQHDRYLDSGKDSARTDTLCLQKESQAIRKNGVVFPMEITVNEFMYDNKRMFTAVIRDITEKKNMENEISKLRMEYEAFLQHELKNYLTPIRGYLDLLIRVNGQNLDNDQKDYLERVSDNTDKMAYLIDKLKSLQEFEKGKYTLDKVAFDLNALIKYVVNDLKLLAENYKSNIELKLSSENSHIMMDRKLLSGVYHNLIKNAIEHICNIEDKNQKKVKIKVFNKNGHVVTTINNMGAVISPRKLKLFFEKFNSDKTLKHNGTGLGTTYAYLVTKAHGGEISVESNEEDGTTVTLKFKNTINSSLDEKEELFSKEIFRLQPID